MPMHETPRKTFKQEIGSWIIFMAVGMAFYYAIVGIGKLISIPFKFLICSERENLEREIAKDQEKILKRNRMRVLMHNDPEDPINLYMSFPKNYENQEWYKHFMNGHIVDYQLRWAPDFYNEMNGVNYPSTKFIAYLENQLTLLKTCTGKDRKMFMKTIRDFYPELDPGPGLGKSIDDLKARALTGDLVKTMVSKGVPTKVATEIVSEEVSESDIKIIISIAQKCGIRNYTDKMIKFCYVMGMNPESDEAQVADCLLALTSNYDTVNILARHFDGNKINQILEEIRALRTTNFEETLEEKLKNLAYKTVSTTNITGE